MAPDGYRDRWVRWLTGRCSDTELAAAAGMSVRNLRLVLGHPSIKDEVRAGGRGSWKSRRLSPAARNAVAMVGALHRAGLTFDLSCRLVGAVPEVLRSAGPLIDFCLPEDLVHHPRLDVVLPAIFVDPAAACDTGNCRVGSAAVPGAKPLVA